MPTTGNLSEFYRQVAFYRYHDGFDVGERDYKIRLSKALAETRLFVKTDPIQTIRSLRRALKTGTDNNIINWRVQSPPLDNFETDPMNAAEELGAFWDDSFDLRQRFIAFSKAMAERNLRQPGAQLVVGSTLLMALSIYDFPPVRMEAFSKAMNLAGWDTLYSVKKPVDRYILARSFMDAIIEQSVEFGIHLRDRLDAQGVIWCVSGGWPKVPVPPWWVNDPEGRAIAEQLKYGVEYQILATEQRGNELLITEKQALVQARRGQGKFREGVVALWSNCAVTECGELTLLRASHIKPWKASENFERLDPYNGLLLAPNLDAAFDAGLVAFSDEGRIMISRLLNSVDMTALGIRRDFRLRKVDPSNLPYLRYHREKIFRK
jgi:hypothetical protein